MQYIFLNSVSALVTVVALILSSAWLVRRFRPLPAKTEGRLRIESTLVLDPKHRLHVVACDGRCVLLLTGSHDLVVGWLPDHSV